MKKVPWRPLILLSLVAAVIVAAPFLGVRERLQDLSVWVRSLGPAGGLVFMAIYVVAVVVAVPASVLTVAAGALFGSFWGVLYVNLAATLGAALAFLVARFVARQAVSRWLAGNEKFRRLDALVGRHGAVVVAITRLVPLFPFNLLNYGFGLTSVPFTTYLFWSWLCMIPGTVLYVVGADALFSGLRQGKVPWSLVAVVTAAAVIVTLLVRQAKKRLREGES